MANNNWAPEGTKETFRMIGDLEGHHPAIPQLCAAVVDLCNIKPTSLAQKENAINTFRFIISAINMISENDKRYPRLRIEDPFAERSLNEALD